MDDAVGSFRPGIAAPARSRAEPDRSPQPSVPTTPGAGLSFPDFYREHFPGLVAFVMWLGARAEEAADVAQEAMTRAYSGWEGIEHPRAWVRVVASREYCRLITACRDEPVAETPDRLPPPGLADTSETAMLGPQQARVLDMLRLLPQRQRQVMAWVYDGYTPAEIAAILNLAPGTVRGSLHKARETLKHHMAAEGGQLG